MSLPDLLLRLRAGGYLCCRCCTVNHPQGWPKFVSNAFVTTPDQSGLVQLYHGPFSTSTTLTGGTYSSRPIASPLTNPYVCRIGNQVTATVDTLYPFSDTLTTAITANKAFTYYVRIPSWVTAGTISVNGGKATAVEPVNGLHSISVPSGKTTLTLNLPAAITVGMPLLEHLVEVGTYRVAESRPQGSIAVHRGPLHYAYQISHNQTVIAQNSVRPILAPYHSLSADRSA